MSLPLFFDEDLCLFFEWYLAGAERARFRRSSADALSFCRLRSVDFPLLVDFRLSLS